VDFDDQSLNTFELFRLIFLSQLLQAWLLHSTVKQIFLLTLQYLLWRGFC